jgi:hypothetical protein
VGWQLIKQMFKLEMQLSNKSNKNAGHNEKSSLVYGTYINDLLVTDSV